MAVQQASKNNLLLFKKGNIAGKGRPKKLPKLDELLADVLSREVNGRSAAESILLALVAAAKKGDCRAAELLLNRGWGKLKDTAVVISGVEEKPEPSFIQWGAKKIILHGG